MKRIVLALSVGLVIAMAALAQQTAAATGQTKPAEQGAPPQATRPEPPGANFNIKLDLTITDQAGSGEPVKKTVTLLVVDRGTGSIRSMGAGRGQVNVDARPTIVNNSLVRLALGLEYNPRSLGKEAPSEWSSLNEQMTVLLAEGRPLVVSQAADPSSDRKITVEVRATILK